MENLEDLEDKILEKIKEDIKKCGGANGSNINDLDKIINLPISERNQLLKKMVNEKKIAYINTLNAPRITIPK